MSENDTLTKERVKTANLNYYCPVCGVKREAMTWEIKEQDKDYVILNLKIPAGKHIKFECPQCKNEFEISVEVK